MSFYTHIDTQFKDAECLLEALVECGWTLDQIELHLIPANLYGFQGDVRQDKAHIIIRRQHVGRASNDVGFERNEDGTYTAHISEYDKQTQYGDGFVNKLKQNYGVKVAEKIARKRGMLEKKRTVLADGTIKIVLQKAGK